MEGIDQVTISFRKGDYKTALGQINALLKNAPDNPDFLLYNKALCQYYLGGYQNAIRTINSIGDFSSKSLYENARKLALKCRKRAIQNPKKKEGQPTEMITEDGLVKSLKFYKPTETFSDVIGMKAEKLWLYKHVILPLKRPDLYRKHNQEVRGAVILYGSPGNGKTYLCRALAGETKANFLPLRMHQILNMYVGNDLKNCHIIFEQARKYVPCIIFIDEMDAISQSRTNMKDTIGSGSAMSNMINELLQEVDGLEKNPEGLFLIGTTNRPWDIDPAIKRSGRFEDKLYVRAPGFSDRMQLFQYYTTGKPQKNLNFGQLALATTGYSAVDIKSICSAANLNDIYEEEKTAKETSLTTGRILRVIKEEMPQSTVDEWYVKTRKELLGTVETTMVDGKIRRSWRSGSLEPEERRGYRELLKDINSSTSVATIRIKSILRNIAMVM